jgi:drug/metabolite transporter (DMT)-like permease
VDDNSRVRRLTLAAFGTTVLVGGSNFVVVKFSNAELAPLYGAAVRFTAAAALLGLLMWARSLPLPSRRALVGHAIYGALAFGVCYGLMYFALLQITAGTAAVIMAGVPLFTLLLAVLHRQERLTAGSVAGGVLVIAGIGVLSLRSLGGELPFLHVMAAVVAALATAEATVVVKGFPRSHPITTNAVGMATGALLLWLGSALMAERWTIPEQGRTWAALAWLVIVGSVGMFYLVLFIIRQWTASATAYCLALMPVVAVTLGTLLAGEPITAEVLAGAALVALAVYVGAIRQPRREPRRSTARYPG